MKHNRGRKGFNPRIAMLAPISWRTPPQHYGPWELVTSLLTEGLVERGLDVTLFATLNSVTRAKLRGVAPRGYSEDPELDPKVWEGLHISEVFEHADAFDLIHNQFDFLPLTYSGLVRTPLLTTIHGFSSPRILPVYEKYNDRVHYVSISDADRSPKLDYLATVYHGIPLEEFPFTVEPDDYLLFFGRIHREKGTWEAIQVARAAGRRLVIAGIIQDADYFAARVKPFLDDDRVRYIGPVERRKVPEVLGRATALLHLINFDEPFGMSVVEAMACGTPVVAVNRGAMPELVRHGETGFLVDAWRAAVEILPKVSDLSRSRCRAWVESRFTQTHMIDAYLEVYKKILQASGTN